MIPFRPDIPPHVAEVIRSLHPDIKRLVKSAVRVIVTNPECGEPLKRELEGLRKYRVRRFRIVYAVDQKTRVIRLMAVGHRRQVYEELTEQLRGKKYGRPLCSNVAAEIHLKRKSGYWVSLGRFC